MIDKKEMHRDFIFWVIGLVILLGACFYANYLNELVPLICSGTLAIFYSLIILFMAFKLTRGEQE